MSERNLEGGMLALHLFQSVLLLQEQCEQGVGFAGRWALHRGLSPCKIWRRGVVVEEKGKVRRTRNGCDSSTVYE